MRRWLCLLAAFATLASAPAMAQAPDAGMVRQARALLEETTTTDGPGAVMLIAHGDRVVFQEARGMANIELAAPLAPGQTFRIASITKIFTAATVVKLAGQGRLSLDDPLARFLPDFPEGGRITIRQLLNHTAGVSDRVVNPQPGFSRRDVDIATLVGEIRKRPLDFEPGSRFSYSNAGYILLGAVLEAVTGGPWHEAVRAGIIDPLGLSHTAYAADAPITPGRVSGYTTDTPDGAVANARYLSITGPASAGALHSTADDLRLWLRALSSGRLVSPEDFRGMVAPPTLTGGEISPYGLGLYVWKARGLTMVGHTGQINGFAAIAAYLPERDVTIVILANDDHFDARTIGHRLAAIAIGDPYPAVVSRPLSEREATGLPGVYGQNPASTRTLLVRDGSLFAQRPGRDPYPMQVSVDGRLYFVPDELSYFAPVRDGAGRVIALDEFRNGEAPARRLSRVEPAPR